MYIYFLTERRNAMQEVLDIIMALIEQIPWFSSLFIVYTVYKNKPKKTSISISDKVNIISER